MNVDLEWKGVCFVCCSIAVISCFLFFFLGFCSCLGILDESIIDKWLSVIKDRYSEPWRSYHSLTHVDALLKEFSLVKHSLASPSAVLAAIFFHDLVYDPKSKTNEKDSAILWEQFASEAKLADAELVANVSDFILQTASHMSVDVEKASFDKLTFLDLDLSILGSSEKDYSAYASQIRQEYAHVEDDAFKAGFVTKRTKKNHDFNRKCVEKARQSA